MPDEIDFADLSDDDWIEELLEEVETPAVREFIIRMLRTSETETPEDNEVVN